MEGRKEARKRKSSTHSIDDEIKSKKAGGGDKEDGQHNSEENQEEMEMNIPVQHLPDDPELPNYMDDEDREEQLAEEMGINFTEKFDMKHFRMKLKGNNFITDLRHFLHLHKQGKHVIDKYLEKKGTALEIVEAFKRVDSTNAYQISYLAEVYRLIVEYIATNKPNETEVAAETCRFFMKNHCNLLRVLLKSGHPEHRKTTIGLMTVISILAPVTIRSLLNCFDEFKSKKELGACISRSGDEVTVRDVFIRFILSLLVDGTTFTIRVLLDKYELIGETLYGLVYDDHEIVISVLTAFKKCVLESLLISKTKKVRIFDTQNNQHLFWLYNWKGPGVLNAMKQKQTKIPDLGQFIDKEKQNIVRLCVNDFLILLLSSRKYGIAFDAMKNFRQKKNEIQQTTLSLLKEPYKDPLKKQLVFRILVACPELAEGMIRNLSRKLNPHAKYTAEEEQEIVLKIMIFISEIVAELTPEVMRGGLDQITLSHFARWLKELCLPARVLHAVSGKFFLRSMNPKVRFHAVKILSTLFQQYCNYMVAMINREKFKGNDLRKFRFEMLDYLLLHFPRVNDILLTLFNTAQNVDNTETLIEHMDCTFDLLTNIRKVNKSLIAETSQITNYISLLYPILKAKTDKKTITVLVKGINLQLSLSPRALLMNAKHNYLLQNVYQIYIKDVMNEQKVTPILQKSFLNSNVFDNGLLEVDIWLEAMRITRKDQTFELTDFCEYILSAQELTLEKIDYSTGSTAKALFSDIEKGNTINGFMDIPTLSRAFVRIMQDTSKHPMYSNFFEVVSFFLFHFIPAPRVVLEMYSKHYSKYYKYMMSWVNKEKPGKLDERTISGFNQMYTAILEGKSDFINIFKGNEKIVVDATELNLKEDLKRNSYVMLHIYQICFITSQLAEKQNLELIQANAASHYLTHLLYILHNDFDGENEGIEELDAKGKQETEVPYIEHALKFIYSRYLPLLQAFTVFGTEVSDKNFMKFICNTTEIANKFKIYNFKSITINYRSKIVSQITATIEETLKTNTVPSSETVISLLETFQMSDENCFQLLASISRLKVKHFIVDLHNRSMYFDILVFIFNRLAELKKIAQNESIVSKIGTIYVKLLTRKKVEFSVEKLEESFYNFLRVSHQCIALISKDVFHAIFENMRVSKSTVKFACLLAERREDLRQEFVNILPKQLSKKELVYPLLNVLILSGFDVDLNILLDVYKEYKSGIMKTIERPQKAAVIYKENIETSIYLIEKCMPNADFHKKTLKTDSVEIFQLQLIEAIHRKEMLHYREDSETLGRIFVNFVNSFIQYFHVLVKREPIEAFKVSAICYSLYNWIEGFSNVEYDSNMIVEAAQWTSFCKYCLKYGMRAVEENDQEIIGSEDSTNSLFLKLLAYLFDKFYDNNANNTQAPILFEMITSHSRFFEIVLAKDQSCVKTHLMQLILVLAQKNNSIMEEKHVPVWLGAYNAKLSHCDRFILALLQYYEKVGINCNKYKPFIWGEYAIEQYSLKPQDDQPILVQELSIAQLMSIVDRNTSEFTVINFPVWRNLDTLTQLPTTKFENPHVGWRGYGSTELEQKIESGENIFDKSFLKLYPVAQAVYDECYDPAFIIPLLIGALAPGTYLHPVKPVQNGLLGIAFAALSSFDTNMRLAAGLAHLRYRDHFQGNKFLDKPLWNQAYDNVQTGLSALQNRWSKHKKALVPRVPYVSGIFLSVSMTTLVDPLDPMYKILSMYLRVKSTFDFLCVPEFHVLFHSPEVDHLTHRQFILNTIRNGIKCSSDLFLLVTTGTFKALMGFYGTPISNSDINLRILSIINVCVKIPASVKLMIDHIGIIPWLNSVIDSTEFFYFDTIEAITNVISNLWYALKAVEESANNLAYVEARIFRLIIKLAPLVSNRLSLKSFIQFLNIMAKTANGHHTAISVDSLNHIVSCSHRHFSDHLWYIDNVREFGVKCIESNRAYLKSLKESNLDDMRLLGLLSLRNFVVKWKALAT